MQQNSVTVDQWVAMFREAGLDEAGMGRWHRLFEEKHPDAHEAFLRWLNLPEERIAAIRARYR